MFFDQGKLDFGFALKETFLLRAQYRFHCPDGGTAPVIRVCARSRL
jgi:hypothetical protein